MPIGIEYSIAIESEIAAINCGFKTKDSGYVHLTVYNMQGYYSGVMKIYLFLFITVQFSGGVNHSKENEYHGCGSGPYEMPDYGQTTAVKNSWPSMVSILKNNQHFCGGSLIDSIHVMTAAHCVISFRGSKMKVALGMHTLKPVMDPQVTKMVSRVAYHKDFNQKTYYNDIALLTLDSPVVFTKTISPICLPPKGSSDLHSFRKAVTIGWGITVKNGIRLDALKQMTISTIPSSTCRSRFVNVVPSGIADHMICAYYPGAVPCSGDSGGPLLIQDMPGGKWLQIGIVSWGVECGVPGIPEVYTRMTSFVDWIDNQIQSDPHAQQRLNA